MYREEKLLEDLTSLQYNGRSRNASKSVRWMKRKVGLSSSSTHS